MTATSLFLLALGCAARAPQLAPAPEGRIGLEWAMPVPQAPAPFVAEPPQALPLLDGGELWVLPMEGLPLVSLRLLVPGGLALDPADKPGLTGMTSAMLLQGAGERDAAAFARAVDQLAADLDVTTSGTTTTIQLDVHADRLQPALDLLADMLFRPRFEGEELQRQRELRLSELTSGLDDPRIVANWVSTFQWYGAGHPLALPELGTAEGIAAIQAEDLRPNWEGRLRLGPPRVVVAGAVDPQSVREALESRLRPWPAAEAALPALPAPQARPLRVLVDNPGASQTMISVTTPAPHAHDPQVSAANLGAIVLGGTFTSRLNRLLREEKGYTYGASARLSPSREHGRLVLTTSVQIDATGPALKDLLGELDRLHQGIQPDELDKARGASRTDRVEAAATRAGRADQAAQDIRLGLSTDAEATRSRSEASARPEDALAALARARSSEAMIVVVGDLARIRAAVEAAAPGPWTQVARTGQPL